MNSFANEKTTKKTLKHAAGEYRRAAQKMRDELYKLRSNSRNDEEIAEINLIIDALNLTSDSQQGYIIGLVKNYAKKDNTDY